MIKPKNMITCKLYGRFGNQLFQMATTIGHAIKNNFQWAVPHDTIDNGIWEPHPFRHLPKFESGANRIWKEPSHYYNIIPAEDGLILDGYFQSYKYFEHCINDIRKAFRIPNLIEESILIHTRKGDYAQYPDKHPVLPLSYYADAVRLIFEKRGYSWDNPVYIRICGDDIDHMFEISKGLCRLSPNIVTIISQQDFLTDFYKLCCADDLIIANSSFSLMAGILNNTENSIVIAPDKKQYFGVGNAHLSTVDIYPDKFIQISY